MTGSTAPSPSPPFRKHQAGKQFGDKSILSLELLFTDDTLASHVKKITDRPNPDGSLKSFAGKKKRFAEKAKGFASDEFEEYKKLFDAIDAIIMGEFE